MLNLLDDRQQSKPLRMPSKLSVKHLHPLLDLSVPLLSSIKEVAVERALLLRCLIRKTGRI